MERSGCSLALLIVYPSEAPLGTSRAECPRWSV